MKKQEVLVLVAELSGIEHKLHELRDAEEKLERKTRRIARRIENWAKKASDQDIAEIYRACKTPKSAREFLRDTLVRALKPGELRKILRRVKTKK